MTFSITQKEQAALLAEARETIAAALERRKPEYHLEAELRAALDKGDSALCQPCGAFVTLHKNPGHNLRGCIGLMASQEPLEKTVRRMAMAAAFEDPRFPALEKDELSQCSLEISALSPMQPCPDPRAVQVGVDGLYLIYRGRAGVFLPQVPTEQGWDLEDYLENICYKAGLPAGSWEKPDAQRFIFQAIVFGEGE
jgi:AmmeMemoRadiSam system protein A